MSVISVRGGYRVMVNRDEADTRAEAIVPAWRTLDGGAGQLMEAIWPTDPTGGGTWVGVNRAGLLLTLLNYNVESAPGVPVVVARTGLASRGGIIPQLLCHAGAEAALDALLNADLSRYGPFRLVAVEPSAQGPRVFETRWDMQRLERRDATAAPVCFASSGLGDSLVAVRGELLAAMLREAGEAGNDANVQDAFHRHQWPHAKHVSVMMRREGVRTVSVSTVEWRSGDVRFVYVPVSADEAAGGADARGTDV